MLTSTPRPHSCPDITDMLGLRATWLICAAVLLSCHLVVMVVMVAVVVVVVVVAVVVGTKRNLVHPQEQVFKTLIELLLLITVLSR